MDDNPEIRDRLNVNKSTYHNKRPRERFICFIRARGADFQVGGLTRTRKREPTRGVRGHAPPGKFEILFF